jgi:hypothetical protein
MHQASKDALLRQWETTRKEGCQILEGEGGRGETRILEGEGGDAAGEDGVVPSSPKSFDVG